MTYKHPPTRLEIHQENGDDLFAENVLNAMAGGDLDVWSDEALQEIEKLRANIRRKDETLRAALDRIRLENPDPVLEQWLEDAITDSDSPKREKTHVRTYDNRSVICHAPGDTCGGCDHYYGKADVCRYAPDADSRECDHEWEAGVSEGLGDVWDCHKCESFTQTDPAVDSLTPLCPRTHAAADAFWRVWRQNGETHKHGYYESTWMAVDAALCMTEEQEPQEGEKWEDFLDRLASKTYYED